MLLIRIKLAFRTVCHALAVIYPTSHQKHPWKGRGKMAHLKLSSIKSASVHTETWLGKCMGIAGVTFTLKSRLTGQTEIQILAEDFGNITYPDWPNSPECWFHMY